MERSTKLRPNLDQRLTHPHQILRFGSPCPKISWRRERNPLVLVIHQDVELSDDIPTYDAVDTQVCARDSLTRDSKPHQRGIYHYCWTVGEDDRTELHSFNSRRPYWRSSRKCSNGQGIPRKYHDVGF